MSYSNDDVRRMIRSEEVKRINAHSYDKSRRASNRDTWLLNNMKLDLDHVLTEEQIQAVNDFWKPYEFAYKNNWKLQAMYTKISGRFDPSYSGFGMQRFLMMNYWNDSSFMTIRKKAFSTLFFSKTVKSPRMLLMNISGEYLDENRNRISYHRAVDVLYDRLKETRHGEAIMKPSDGGEGTGIRFINSGMRKDELKKVLQAYNTNFVCEEVIKNHTSISVFYDGALNTMRMCTFLWNDEIRFAGAVLRIGVSGRVDNWSKGGLACGINPDGSLQHYAFTEKGEIVTEHPTTGVAFEGHRIYRYEEAVALVKRLHGMIPQQKYVSWDITVDEDGELVLVELNSPGSYELVEMAGYNGYFDKETAKEVFDKYLITNFYYDRANFDWDYREFNDHISLRKYCGSDKEVVIPREIDGTPVRLVYAGAINDEKIEKIVVPETVVVNGRAIVKAAPNCVVVKI